MCTETVAGPAQSGGPNTAVRRIWVDPGRISTRRERIGGLPVVNQVLDRLGLVDVVASYLDPPDVRCRLATDQVIGVVVRNLVLGRQPLYGMGAWAAGYDPALLGLSADTVGGFNDDRVGRALDELFVADRASLVTGLGLAAVRGYDIDCGELHNDSTSLTLYGAYRDAQGTPRGGQTPARPGLGFSKDGRPDLKQLVWILTTTADGTVPITHRLADGNTEDSTTHVDSWDQLVAMLGRTDFMYVADSKLATRDAMEHIDGHHGRFVTVMPRTRKEHSSGRAWLAGAPRAWVEIARRAGARVDDPPEVWHAVAAPAPSAEGFRIIWMRSSTKRVHDAARRLDCIDRAQAGLEKLSGKLRSPRCRLKTLVAVEDAAHTVLTTAHATRWITVTVEEHIDHTYRKEGRGRPGPDSRYRRIDNRSYTIAWHTDTDAVAFDAAADGTFPLVTNDRHMTPAGLLTAYKGQPHLERRNHTLKGVLDAAPIELNSDRRIDALAFCLYAALLVHALIERQLRVAMADAGIDQLPLYHEQRPCTTPTAARVLEILEPLARTHLTHDGHTLAIIDPEPTSLQRQLLELLDIPLTAYQTS